ncbi:CAP domain-containing protein [Rhodopirellula sp. P2]|uniref:CAP domain-containing protein n=1 Tax=Rhodopirellula sp. P2 TaxID=2127060 RepID=UPI002367A267|nr:CAP domain-containing protein [Rhodopirellula sp. P2]WDQ16967.1 CAP domain-containing protein [Rhodopirellula sp. P2]
MSRLFEASRFAGRNPLAKLVQGLVPRLFVPHLPALIAIGGITCGSMLATSTEAHAANGRVVQRTTIPTGSGCTNCGQNRSVVMQSAVSSQTVSVGTPVQHSQPVQHGQPVQHSQLVQHGRIVHPGSPVVGGTQVFHSSQPVHVGQTIGGSQVVSQSPAIQHGQVIQQPSQPAVTPVSHSATHSHRVGGAVSSVLSTLNAQRSRQGLRGLAYDPQLQAVAERRAQLMASTGLKTHPSGSFAPGRYEGVGWSSSHTPAGVSACYTSDPNMRVAGAAMARGRDGVYFCVVYR